MSNKMKGDQWGVSRTTVSKERSESPNVNVLSKRAVTMLLASSLIIGEGSAFLTPIEADAYSKDNDNLLSAGQYATFALSTNGTLYSWGSDSSGMLGNGTSTEVKPATVSLTNVVQVDAGQNHAIALRKDGTVWGWGYNTNGEIGDGGSTSSTVPKQVTHYSITNVKKVKAGENFTMVLKNDGTLWGWGQNASGQLGTVNTVASKTPVQVKGVNGVGFMTDVVDFDLGSDHVLAITSDGSVYAWGEGNDGQLGLNSTGDRNAPTKITSLSGIVAVSAGDARSYAVRNDGKLFAFGDNVSGRLGDGGTADKLVPTVLNVSGVIDVDAAENHTIALKSDGTVLGWGINTYGQVGNGTTVTQKTPAQVLMSNGQPLTGVEAIDAGGSHSHALLADGSVWSWGFNSNEELGIGNTTSQRFATQSFSPSLFAPPEPEDETPPSISLSASQTTPTSADLTINATITDDKAVAVKKWAMGNQTASYFATQGNVLTGTSFVVTANGTYTVYAKDEAGNESVQTITVSNIDKVAPTMTLTRNGNVIQVTASDANGIKSIKLPNGTVVNGSTASYTITANGTLSFEATDNANNVGTQSMTISDFDNVPPAAATFSPSTTNPTNGNVTVTINYPSDAVTKEYKIGTGAWATYTAAVQMTANGTIYARSKDAAGNLSSESSYNVTNIDKTAPGVATFTPNTTSPASSVSMTITYPSDASVKEYRIGATGTWTAYTSAVVMDANGTIYARSSDAAGNQSAESSHTVSNIDTIAPAAATFSADKTTPTNTNVTITITYPTDGAVKEYKIGETGTWTAYTTPVAMTANNTIYARSKDTAGNVSAESSYVVSNIDKIAPAAATLVADKTTATKDSVNVTITYPSDASVKQYKIGSAGTWTAYTTPVALSENNTVYARSIDSAGNTSVESSLVVNNIDNTAPVAATFSADKTTPTSGNVNVTITFPSDASVKQYKVGASGTWTTYTGAVSMTTNETIYARSSDAAGNQSVESSYVVSNIDKTAPGVATFSADKTTPTTGSVTVTVTYPSDASVKQYKVGLSGTWTAYTAPVVMTANDTIYARSTDAAGNTSAESSYVVSNIDATAPVAATFSADKTTPTNGDVNVTITFPSDASTKEYKIGSSGTWTTYTGAVAMTANGTIYARSSDSAGNQSVESNYVVSNIDKTAPVAATFSADKTTPTNGNVNITITFPSDASIKQYKIGSSGAWTTYTGAVPMTANGTIYARSTDAAGNQSVESNYVVSNIDKTAPGVATFSADKTTPTTGNVTVTVTYPSDASVKQYKVGASGTWTAYTTPIVMTTNDTIYARSSDAAGNQSAESNYVVSNIDKTAPGAATFSADTTTPTQGNVTVTITYPADGTVKEYRVGTSGTWTAYTTPVVMTANGTIYARSSDNAGNQSVESNYVVSNIDKVAPSAATFTPDKTTPTNGSVNVTITFPSDSTVKEYRIGTSGTWTAYTTPVAMTANGTIYARSSDAAGNQSVDSSYVVNNIDKTAPGVATFSADKTTITNENVTVTITYPTDGAVKEYKIGASGTWTAYTSPVAISANGTIYARSTDAAGNMSTESSYVVNNIDKVAPDKPIITSSNTETAKEVTISISFPADAVQRQVKIGSGAWTTYSEPIVLSANATVYARAIDAAGNVSPEATLNVINVDSDSPDDPTFITDVIGPTNSDVTLTIEYSDDSTVKEYKIGEAGTWKPYTTAIVMTSNGTVYARSADSVGNQSKTVSFVVDNIDKTAPSTPVITVDKTAATNGNVTVSISFPADAVEKKYSIGNGQFQDYTGSFVVTENVTIRAEGYDAVGNKSATATYNVTNIDKIAPVAPTFTPDITAPTSGSVKVTINYPADGTVKEYKVGSTGTWTTYTGAVVMTENGIIYARSRDLAGNTSVEASYEVNNIDDEAPLAPTLTADKTTITNGNVNVTIVYPSDAAQKQYKIGSTGTWTAYSTPVAITTNTTVLARAIDASGNISEEASLVIGNIDKVAPVSPTFTPTNGTNKVTVGINYSADSVTKEYKIGSTGTWMPYTAAVVMTENGTIYARSKDAAGNVSAESNFVVSSIDNEAPEAPTLVADVTSATSGNVSVTVTYPSDAVTKQYKLGEAGVWQTYSTPVTISSNVTVYARGLDAAGNISEEASLVVSNIDKTPPTAPTFTADESPTQVVLTILYSSDSEVKEYRIGSTGTWVSYTGAVTLTENVTVYARSKDAVGNVSSESQFAVTAIDDVAPADATFVANTTAPTKDPVIITIEFPTDAVTKEYRISSTGEWKAYTGVISLTDNEIVYARSSDAVGNVSNVSSYIVNNIDNTPPVAPVITVSTTEPVTVPITVGITYPSDADVKQYKIGDGEWKTYTIAFQVASNTTVYARAIDALGNISAVAEVVINNIVGYDGSRPLEQGDLAAIQDPTVRSAFENVLTKVQVAEKYLSASNVRSATDAFNALPISFATDPQYKLYYEDLRKRVDELKNDYNYSVALQAVIDYERYKLSSYKTRAQNAVNILPDSPEKADLQARIDAV